MTSAEVQRPCRPRFGRFRPRQATRTGAFDARGGGEHRAGGATQKGLLERQCRRRTAADGEATGEDEIDGLGGGKERGAHHKANGPGPEARGAT